jgi:hypothetical protein
MRWSHKQGHERDGNLTNVWQEESQVEGIESACGLQTASQPCDDIWNASALQMVEQLYEGICHKSIGFSQQ